MKSAGARTWFNTVGCFKKLLEPGVMLPWNIGFSVVEGYKWSI